MTPLTWNTHTSNWFLNDNGLTQMVNSPTRGNNILDIFITNRPSTMQSCEVIWGISDHEAILTKDTINIHLQDPSKRLIYLWSKADFNNIRQNIQSLIQEYMSSYSVSTPVNVFWNKFSDICYHCLKLIPTKTLSAKFHQPWITNHVKRLTRRKQQVYNHARLTNHPNDSSFQKSASCIIMTTALKLRKWPMRSW